MTAEEQAIRDWIGKAGLEIRKLALKQVAIIVGDGAGSFSQTLIATRATKKKKLKAKSKKTVVRSIVPPTDPLQPKPLPPTTPIADSRWYFA